MFFTLQILKDSLERKFIINPIVSVSGSNISQNIIIA